MFCIRTNSDTVGYYLRLASIPFNEAQYRKIAFNR